MLLIESRSVDMFIQRCCRYCRVPLLAAAVFLLTPTWSSAQYLDRDRPAIPPNDFVGYRTSAYAGYVTDRMPTYMTSLNYPTIYGRWSYGSMWSNRLAATHASPFTSYPSTYSPVAPPTAAGFSQLYYNTGPGGST